jgi:hypothetical protein
LGLKGILHAYTASSKGVAMGLEIKSRVFALEAGQVVAIDEAAGLCIASRAGTVWVTEEDDYADHIVGPGEARTVKRGGRTVIQALQPAWIAIRSSGCPPALQ